MYSESFAPLPPQITSLFSHTHTHTPTGTALSLSLSSRGLRAAVSPTSKINQDVFIPAKSQYFEGQCSLYKMADFVTTLKWLNSSDFRLTGRPKSMRL